jgi:hypothetical protein
LNFPCHLPVAHSEQSMASGGLLQLAGVSAELSRQKHFEHLKSGILFLS